MITDPQIIMAVGTPLYILFMGMLVLAAKLIGDEREPVRAVSLHVRTVADMIHDDMLSELADPLLRQRDEAWLQSRLDETVPMERIFIPSRASRTYDTSGTRERVAA